MNYDHLARAALSLYSIEPVKTELIRHNENITYKVTGAETKHLLRIHHPSTPGLKGVQHTPEGLLWEMEFLQQLRETSLQVQRPVKNTCGEWVSHLPESPFEGVVCCTLLEWLEGEAFSAKLHNTPQTAYALGERTALLHQFGLGYHGTGADRPIYGQERIDQAVNRLEAGIGLGLYTQKEYEIICRVLLTTKNFMIQLDRSGAEWGLIHADLVPGNILISGTGPIFIDYCLSGYGYRLFDLGSVATLYDEAELRDQVLAGYASVFGPVDLRIVESLILMDTFISYLFFLHDPKRNGWIKERTSQICSTICRDFLDGQTVFYRM